MLTWLIAIPFLGGLISWQAERFGSKAPRYIALFSMLTLFGCCVYLWMTHDYSLNAWQQNKTAWALEENTPWIKTFNINYHLALDGLSLLMLLLTGFLGVLAVICSWTEVTKRVGFFHLNLLWIIGAVVGVFLAMDMFLFFFFWEMMLIPMFFLISLWGHKSKTGMTRVDAATKFFIYTQASGLLLLVAIIGLVVAHFQATQQLTFDYADLLQTRLDPVWEMVLMLGFFIAFAVKFPIVPFHGWLPDAHSQAPTAGSVDLAGILLKTAAYGLLRFAIPFFPHASQQIAPIAMWLGVAGIIYGAWVAYYQDDIKRLIAYTSISHMGFVLIGIYSFSELALQGVVIQMLAHGISAAALFILSGQIYERLHTRELHLMGGLSSRLAGLPPLIVFFSVASLGLPGLGNFVGEFLILVGTFKVAPVVTVVATSGLVLGAVYSLIIIQRALHGRAKSDEQLPGISVREFLLMLSLIIPLIWLGLYPQPVLDTSAAVMSNLDSFIKTNPLQVAP